MLFLTDHRQSEELSMSETERSDVSGHNDKAKRQKRNCPPHYDGVGGLREPWAICQSSCLGFDSFINLQMASCWEPEEAID